MKTESNRMRIKQETLEEAKGRRFKFSLIDIFLAILTMIIYGDLYNKTVFDLPTLNYFTKVYAVITVVGFLGGFVVNFIDAYMSLDKPNAGEAIKLIYLDLKHSFSWNSFVTFAVGFGVVAAIQFGLKLTQSVTNVDQFNFYVFAGVAEELFFRYFITSAIHIASERAFDAALHGKEKIFGTEVSSKKSKLTWKGISFLISIAISTIVTSFFFYYAHQTRYGSQPEILIGIFLLSAVLTAVYGYDKNVLTCILIHFINNFIAFGYLLITVS